MAVFVGEFDQTLDPKHRLAVPAALREQVDPAEDGSNYYLVLGPDRHLRLYPDRYYQKLLRPLPIVLYVFQIVACDLVWWHDEESTFIVLHPRPKLLEQREGRPRPVFLSGNCSPEVRGEQLETLRQGMKITVHGL